MQWAWSGRFLAKKKNRQAVQQPAHYSGTQLDSILKGNQWRLEGNRRRSGVGFFDKKKGKTCPLKKTWKGTWSHALCRGAGDAAPAQSGRRRMVWRTANDATPPPSERWRRQHLLVQEAAVDHTVDGIGHVPQCKL